MYLGFANLLRVDEQTGAVYLAEQLDRNSVASITLNIQVESNKYFFSNFLAHYNYSLHHKS